MPRRPAAGSCMARPQLQTRTLLFPRHSQPCPPGQRNTMSSLFPVHALFLPPSMSSPLLNPANYVFTPQCFLDLATSVQHAPGRSCGHHGTRAVIPRTLNSLHSPSPCPATGGDTETTESLKTGVRTCSPLPVPLPLPMEPGLFPWLTPFSLLPKPIPWAPSPGG